MKGSMKKTWKKVFIPVDPVTFAIKFIEKLRHTNTSTPPSLRQTVAIAKLLFYRIVKYQNLVPQDYIDVAVLTTYYEDQQIARKIAEELLEELLLGKKPPKEEIQKILKQMPSDVQSVLQEIFEEIQLLSTPETPIHRFLTEFRKNVLQKRNPWFLLSQFVSEREIIFQGISSLDELIKYAQIKIFRKLGSLSPREARICVELNWLNILEKSPAPWESIIPTWIQTRNIDVLKNIKDLNLLAKTIDFLYKARLLDEKTLNELIDYILKKIVTLKDLINALRYLKNIGNRISEKLPEIVEETLRRMPLKDALKYAQLVDSLLGTNIAEELFEKALEQKPKLETILELPIFSQKWRELVSSEINKMISQIEQTNVSRKEKYRAYLRLYEKLKRLSRRIPIAYARHFFLMNLSSLRKAILLYSPSPIDFLTQLRKFRKNEPLFAPSLEEVLSLARKFEIPEEKIHAIYGSKWHQLKHLFKTASGGFNELMELLHTVKPDFSKTKELFSYALANKSDLHIATLLYYDFRLTASVASLFEISVEQLLPSLTAGPGKNLIQFWYEHKDSIPRHCLGKLIEMVKKTLLEIALEYGFKLFGSIERTGIIPSNETRVFLCDEDFEYIDIEETLENLILMGKNPLKIPMTLHDLRVRKREKRKIPFIFVLDFSGSMAGEKLALCAITVAMLALKLKPEEFACCLFESNTYIMKNITEKKNVEQIVSDLLQIRARGGTMASGALKWAKHQIKKVQNLPLAIFMILSDFCFYDEENALKIAREISQFRNVRTFLLAPYFSYDRDSLKRFQRVLRGEVILLRKLDEIPIVISQMIRKFLG